MQPNTLNTHHDTGPPVPPELLEAVARALAAALIPPPRAPAPPETEDAAAEFLTAAQLAQRLGDLPGDGPTAGDRRGAAAHRGVPRRPQNDPPVSPAVRRRVRGERPGGADLATFAAAWRARVTAPASPVMARPPRHSSLAGPARFAALAGAGGVPRR